MNYRHKRRILQWNPSRWLWLWMKNIRFRKHENVSLYRIAKVFSRKIQRDEIVDRANAVAFNFILAIFPAIIFLFTLIPYVTRIFPEINQENIMFFLKELIPSSMYDAVSTTVLDIISNQREGLLTLGFLTAAYLSTNGMMALMRAFNACYKTVENRSGLKTRLVATALTLAMVHVLFLVVLLLTVGGPLIDYILVNLPEYQGFSLSRYAYLFLIVFRYGSIFIAFFIAIASIYYFGPAIHYNWRFFSMGSFIATLLCIFISIGFSYYISHFGGYNKLYGSIGVLIALMVWVQMITIVLMFGYEINASIHSAIHTQALWNTRLHRKGLD